MSERTLKNIYDFSSGAALGACFWIALVGADATTTGGRIWCGIVSVIGISALVARSVSSLRSR